MRSKKRVHKGVQKRSTRCPKGGPVGGSRVRGPRFVPTPINNQQILPFLTKFTFKMQRDLLQYFKY